MVPANFKVFFSVNLSLNSAIKFSVNTLILVENSYIKNVSQKLTLKFTIMIQQAFKFSYPQYEQFTLVFIQKIVRSTWFVFFQ